MKSMKSANEFYTPPAKGTYRSTIIAAAAGFSKKGESHIELEIQLEEGPGKGETGKRWLGTDGGTKYGSGSKSSWRALGVNVDTDAEIDDTQLAASLVGRQCLVVLDHEQKQAQNPVTGAYDVPATYVDANGSVLPALRWTVKGFKSMNTAGIQTALQPQTQGVAQAVQQAAPQFAQPPFAGQQAPGGFQQPAFAQPQAPAQAAPTSTPAAPVFNHTTGQWELNGQPMAMNGAPQGAAQPEAGKRTRAKTQIQDV